MSTPINPNSTPSSLRSKLSSYLTGVAIGCVLMGFFLYQRHKSQQRETQSQHTTEQQTQPAPIEHTP